MAEAKGFEPLIPFQVCRFSRPEPSTTRPRFRFLKNTTKGEEKPLAGYKLLRNGAFRAARGEVLETELRHRPLGSFPCYAPILLRNIRCAGFSTRYSVVTAIAISST